MLSHAICILGSWLLLRECDDTEERRHTPWNISTWRRCIHVTLVMLYFPGVSSKKVHFSAWLGFSNRWTSLVLSPAVEENCHQYQGSSAGKPFTDFLPPLCYSHLESASPRINDLRYYIHMNHKLDIVHRSQGQLQPHVFSALTKYLRT